MMHQHQHPGLLHRRFLTDLSSSLFSFVLPLLPTTEERAVKEEVRGLIEKLVKTIEPSARLLSFGSSQNSFGLRNSDMDLVVLIDDPSAGLESSHLVQMIGDLLQRETNFDVKPLPKARIPILKLTLAPSPALPFGIACDIGIENRLAIENTRLLLTYATIDPARVRTLVLFLKVWAKRRRINSPYRGTLSSYGFTLMVLYFLVHVKQPPVLPNLQRIAPIRPLQEHEVMLQGRNVYFFDDTETLRQEWSSINFETVGELLIDFFRYFSHDFQFNNSVMSLRAGQLTKESKGWVNDIDVGGLNEMARDRNRLCIEDPFEITYNVARTVTKDGLYTLRGEFMRATRILTQRPDRAVMALAELCREREDELHRAPRSESPAPRALSATRSAFSTPQVNGGNQPWRSQSQAAPFDRRPGQGFETPNQAGSRRGRQSDGGGGTGTEGQQDYTAQDLWLASQGNNLGNIGNSGSSSLGLGFDGYNIDTTTPSSSSGTTTTNGRGRDTATRGLETPGGFGARSPHHHQTHHHGNTHAHAGHGHGHGNRRINPNFDNGGSGSISAPLSPHRLYAQLEMGKPQTAVWPTAAFDQRLQAQAQAQSQSGITGKTSPGAGAVGATTNRNVSNPNSAAAANVPNARSSSTATSTGLPNGNTNTLHFNPGPPGPPGPPGSMPMPMQMQTSPLPAFAPFSPPTIPSILKPLNGEPASYISPSTLLSPAASAPKPLDPVDTTVPAPAPAGTRVVVEDLAENFEKMGVDAPGQGSEDPTEQRVEETRISESGNKSGGADKEEVAGKRI